MQCEAGYTRPANKLHFCLAAQNTNFNFEAGNLWQKYFAGRSASKPLEGKTAADCCGLEIEQTAVSLAFDSLRQKLGYSGSLLLCHR